MRIVSLIPAGTEIVALLGAESMLVGRSHACDYPESIRDLPTVTTEHTEDAQASSTDAINRQPGELTQVGKSLYHIDIKALADLKPDLILTDSRCEIEPSTLDGTPKILTLNPTTIEDILDDLYRVGQAIGLGERAMHEAVNLRQRMDRAEEHINPYDDGPVCGFMEWTDPIVIAGLWTVQILGRAGARHPLNEVVARLGSGAAAGPQQAQRVAGASIAVSAELFCATNPQYLVIAPRALSLDQAIAQTNRLYAQEPWFRTLPAIINDRVAVVDGNQMFNRPAPRVVDALEFMVGWLNQCEHLIPVDFPWKRWSAPDA